MKKSVIFLINGLGIEKAGSYSISIDQCMPQLSKIKETSYFTTAIINSFEYRTAYEAFFLGDTYKKELDYIKDSILNDQVLGNPVYQNMKNQMDANPKAKLHVFLEPSNDKIVEAINHLVETLSLGKDREVYLHLVVTQQTLSEYKKLIDIINYIKYHIDSHITVGFIIGKEYYPDQLEKEDVNTLKKMFFACSCERWTETDKKLNSLKDSNVRPCVAPGFCATNACKIENGDVLMFFNTRRTNYDKFIRVIYECAPEVFKTNEYQLPAYSMIRLDTQYNIPCFAESIEYTNSLSNLMAKSGKKTLILTSNEHMSLVNFLANGLTYVNNPSIQFMALDENYLFGPENVAALLDTTDYDLYIFDYHMDVSKTINDLKEQLSRIDVVLGNVAAACVNKHSLFITSLYGIKKTLPLAPYNPEEVTIDYEMQIPIFFFDYSYPRSKYALFPGETNDILSSALRCIWENNELYSLVREKGILNNLFKALSKK